MHERLDAAREKLPTKKVLKKERVFDEETGKGKTRLHFEDELKVPKGQSKLQFEADKTVRKVGDTLASGIHGKIHEVEQENSGVEAAHKTEIAAESVVRHYQHHTERSANKPFEKVSKLEQKAEAADRKLHFEKTVAENPEMKTSRANMNKHYQKQHIKKEYAAARKAGAQTASTATKSTAKTVREKASDKVKDFIAKNKKVFAWLGAGLMILILLSAGISSCTAMFTSTTSSVIATSYLSEDDAMTGAEAQYCQMEAELQSYLNNYESTHDYDEYHFDLDTIEHDPYVLISILSSFNEGEFTLDEVQGLLQTLFDRQYILTEDVEVEVRYRTETRTGTTTVTDPETGETSTETYTYEVEVPYNYYICTVTLENFDLSHLPVYIMNQRNGGNDLILVIAEKPSVGAAIGKVLGASCRKDGYLEGNNYIVSWCVGHLVGLADASSYDERFAKWRYSDLPIVPDEWLFEVPKDKQKQFKVLCDLMLDKRVTELVCATDAGREGELIFRLVYKKAGCTKPFKRLWISSLEDSAIREGFAHLRSSGEYDRLYEAALARSKADWIVGINGTRLFSTLYHKKLVVGRVQTPTLAMLVEREGKISTFHKEKYFNVHISKENLTADLEKVKTEEEAKAVAAACDKKQAVVSSLKKETKTVNPPRLYDLTTLQREANRYYGFTAQQALDLVQSLYEKKLLTYPRTDSQFITEDMESTARQVIGIVSRKLPLFGGITHEPDIGRITNNAKVTDHHAIIPTVQLEKQDLGELPESEQKIIRLVAMRLLSATGEKHIYDETSVTLTCEGYEFRAKGKTVVQDGWKAIERRFKESLKSKEKDEPERSLPSLNEKDILSSVDASVTEHYTSPPKPYTEDSLLSAMETAGNAEFDDDTEKKGLGTPATRAGIIEKLVKGGFVERKGKSLVPTKDGNNLVCVLPEQITSPTMTAEWENTLMQIERGNADADKFLSGIVEMTSELVKAYPFLSEAEANRFDTGRESIGKCPRCGSPVYVGKGNYYCSNKECSFCMWEDNKFFSSKKKKLTKKIAAELLDKGWCRVTGLYTPKRPQLYDAVIRLDDTGGKYVSFKMEFEK